MSGSSSFHAGRPEGRLSRFRALWLFGPVVAYCVLIFVLSSQSSGAALPANDKIMHLLAYGGLGVLAVRALFFGTRVSRSWVFLASVLFCTAYGLSDEFHQSFVAGRDASAGDVVADAVGGVLGSLFMLALCRFRLAHLVLR